MAEVKDDLSTKKTICRLADFVSVSGADVWLRRISMVLAIVASIVAITAGSVRVYNDLEVQHRLELIWNKINQNGEENV